MAKINITRLPNATEEYDASQFDQMIRLLEQIVFLLNTNFQQDIREETDSETCFPVTICWGGHRRSCTRISCWNSQYGC